MHKILFTVETSTAAWAVYEEERNDEQRYLRTHYVQNPLEGMSYSWVAPANHEIRKLALAGKRAGIPVSVPPADYTGVEADFEEEEFQRLLAELEEPRACVVPGGYVDIDWHLWKIFPEGKYLTAPHLSARVRRADGTVVIATPTLCGGDMPGIPDEIIHLVPEDLAQRSREELSERAEINERRRDDDVEDLRRRLEDAGLL